MFKDKKLVCFDLDGTLIDSVGIWNQVDAALIQELSNIEVDRSSYSSAAARYAAE